MNKSHKWSDAGRIAAFGGRVVECERINCEAIRFEGGDGRTLLFQEHAGKELRHVSTPCRGRNWWESP